jgi:hypothetical protein
MAKTLLYSLPDEIMVSVMTNVLPGSAEILTETGPLSRKSLLLVLTSICSRIRNLVLDVPSMWAHITFDARRTVWMELCVLRAKQSSLSMHLAIRQNEAYPRELLSKFLSKVKFLEVYVFGLPYSGSLRSIMDSVDQSALQSLVLRTFRLNLIGDEISSLQHTRNLTHLRISVTTLWDLPPIPSLQTLVLSSVQVQTHILHRFLSSAPELSDIEFDILNLSDRSTVGPAHLPRLRSLSVVTFSTEDMVKTLDLMPTPSHALKILIANNSMGPWEISHDVQAVFDRVEQFRTKALHQAIIIPALLLSTGVPADSGHSVGPPVSISLRDTWDKQPSLTCTWHRVDISHSSPLLDSIRIMHVRQRDRGGVDTSPLRLCPNVGSLVVRKQARDAWDKTPQDYDQREHELEKTVSDLDKYIRGRSDEGRPLNSFTFEVLREEETSSTWRGMFDRLAAEYGSGCVTWTVGRERGR